MAKKPNAAAQALGRKRWAGTKAADRSQAMSELGTKRAESLTAKKRAEIAAKAAATRWAKHKKKPATKKKATG